MSTNNLTLSPDGMSIQLSPEPPKQLSPPKSQLSDSTITSPIFRNDVREEWINAMFGPDFYPKGFSILKTSPQDTFYKPRRQGVGLSGIASYVCYTATIPALSATTKDSSSSISNNKNHRNIDSSASEEKEATTTTVSNVAALSRGKVGVTLSRIPLGVYVRMVDIESEAYCAGVIPGSVLIDINGMGVLGEPSHKLLERLWVYEGHFATLGSAVALKNDNSILLDHSTLTSDGTAIHPKLKKGIMGPVALKFIKDGVVYTVVLLTGAPFGISWAPAGNFALVQRAYAHAQTAGVTRGCIVAAVNDKSLRDMDHLDTAMELKEQFHMLRDIQISCVYTPAASRTSHHEDHNHQSNKKKSVPAEIKTIDGVRIRKVNPFRRNTKEETPLEYGAGTFFSCGTGPNYAPTTEGELNTDLISEIAIRVAAGEVLAPTGMKRGLSSITRSSTVSKSISFADILTDKAMAEQAGKNTTDKRLIMSIMESQNKYMECPLLTWTDVITRWNYLHTFVFALRMHSTSYSMNGFSDLGGMIGTTNSQKGSFGFPTSFPLHSTKSTLELLKSLANMTNSVETIRHSLLQFVSLLSSKVLLSENIIIDEEFKSKEDLESKVSAELDNLCVELVGFLGEMALKDDDLCQTLHFLLRAYAATYSEIKRDDKSPLSPMSILTSAISHLRYNLQRNENTPQQPITSPKLSPTKELKSEPLVSFADQMNTSILPPNAKSRSIAKRIASVFKKKKKTKPESNLYGVMSKSDSFDSSPKLRTTKDSYRPNSILRKTQDQLTEDSGSLVIPGVSSLDILFDNMNLFLDHLDAVAEMIETTLMKSFGQRITDWGLLHWNDGKNNAFGDCTNNFRVALQKLNEKKTGFRNKSDVHWSPVLNPMECKEVLLSVVPDQSYILPSAHFPLLLTFESAPRNLLAASQKKEDQKMLYRTKVTVDSIRSVSSMNQNVSYVAHICVGGTVQETGKSSLDPYFNSTTHRWNTDDSFTFDSSRLWCRPDTVELRVSSIPFGGTELEEFGFAMFDISKIWTGQVGKKATFTSKVFSSNNQGSFGQDGFMTEELVTSKENLIIEISVIGEKVPLCYGSIGSNTVMSQRRMLLYKHDEDMRQEMLAIQFIATCDRILKASGLDLKIKTYGCIPVGSNKGFIEWVPGALSLSELCKPIGSHIADKNFHSDTPYEAPDAPSTALQRTGGWCMYESLRHLRNKSKTSKKDGIGLSGENPLQEFLRSNAYDENAPYFIKKEVMDTFVKSCAGYCVITYLLGVGDRHTDNLLLHPHGYFFHCDYSFILGQDPKTYLPMRITSQMIDAMGGKESDNFAKFLSLVGAAFVALRQPSSVRILMSMIKGMVDAKIPDISIHQKPENALHLFHERFCLHLNDSDAVLFLEENISRSSTSKLWVAVDALHSLGKRF